MEEQRVKSKEDDRQKMYAYHQLISLQYQQLNSFVHFGTHWIRTSVVWLLSRTRTLKSSTFENEPFLVKIALNEN